MDTSCFHTLATVCNGMNMGVHMKRTSTLLIIREMQMRYHLISVRMTFNKKTDTKSGNKHVEKREPLCTVVGM